MAMLIPSRTLLSSACKATFVLGCVLFAAQEPVAQMSPGPPNSNQGSRPPSTTNPASRVQQQHLSQWMDSHRNLPLNQQQHALEQEPGFRDLSQGTQQRMLDRLSQLNTMAPDQRRRLLDRTEKMEQLSPPQRQQVRGAMQQLSTLPADRRRLVARAFRDIREMPLPQRILVLNSERFRSQFSDQERGTLANLLTVEPYLPAQHGSDYPNRPE